VAVTERRPAEQRSIKKRLRPAKLSDAEREAWIGLLRVHNKLINQLDAELQSAHGLPLAAFDVLVQLARAENAERSMSDLAESILLSPSGCTRLVDRLEAEGLVERRRSARDSRVVMAAITPSGRRRMMRAVPVHLRGVRERFTERLSGDELETLGRVWHRLLDSDG